MEQVNKVTLTNVFLGIREGELTFSNSTNCCCKNKIKKA